tara:strand:+ start:966 stop:1649 length:684 start_codon:yes stop_codon:yes gene_type:complete
MKDKRVLVLTGASDDFPCREGDVEFSKVYELTLKSKRNYAEKHGYDYMELRSFGSDPRNILNEKEVGFLRAVRCFEMLKTYDVVMWIDGDSIITNDSFQAEDFIEDGKVLSVSRDWCGVPSLSSGNFVLYNTEGSDEFIDNFYSVAQFTGAPQEQQTFRGLFGTGQIKMLHHDYLNAVSSHQEECNIWHDRAKVQNVWSENSFLVHLTGLTNRDRIELMRKYFSDYL